MTTGLDETAGARNREIRVYLETGTPPDPIFPNWPGSDLVARAKDAERALRNALIAELGRRVGGRIPPSIPAGFDSVDFARTKLAPMVNGLFPKKEQAAILDLLEGSIVFLTPENIERVVTEHSTWLSTAWDLANIYLSSLSLPPIGCDRVCIVGLSEETRCYVSTAYFTEQDPYADFVVHESAHVFHNWKREYAGLPYTRNREWLLPIKYQKRETFAYACETYSRILEGTRGLADRRRRLAEYAANHAPTADIVSEELVDILTEAVAARNGWKRILTRCSYLKRP